MEAKTRINTAEITMIGLMAAVTCILGPLSIPIGPVPISFTNLAVYLAVILLGLKRGTISYLVYLLVGLTGVPVFSSFTGGPAKLFGPTGGYLAGFIFMALITGLFVERFRDADSGKQIPMYFAGMVLGTAVTYLFGTAWLAFQAQMSFSEALAAGVIPFLPGDIAKMVIAACAGPAVRKQIVRAGFLGNR